MQSSPGILLLGNHAPPFGGVPNHVALLARHLVEVGWRVHVLADISERRGTFSTTAGYTVHAPSTGRKIGAAARSPLGPELAQLVRATRNPWPHMAGDFARARITRDLVRRHGLHVMSAYHVLKPGLSAMWVSRDLQIPLVTTVFGEFYDRPDEHRQRIADVEAVLSNSAAVLSPSQHCADSVNWLGVDVPALAIYHGVDVARFSPDAAPAKSNAMGGRVVVAYVARMVTEMGLGVFLEAIPSLLGHPLVDVVIAGARGGLYDDAAEMSRRWPARISLRPDFADDELPEIYEHADIVVAPSTNNRACLGLSIIEAMASGVPVIGCDVGGTPEVIADGVTGTLVAPGDPDSLADATLRYADDSELRRRHGQAGLRRAERLFDVSITNRRCEDLFRSLLPRELRDSLN